MSSYKLRILSLFFILSLSLQANQHFQNVRLIWTTNPQSESKIIWETDSPTKTDYIKIWTEGSDPIEVQGVGSQAYSTNKKPVIYKQQSGGSTLSEFNGPWYYHTIELENLEASTTYHFTAHSDEHNSRVFHFTTAPEDERPFKLLFVGDSRTRVEIAKEISQQLGEMAARDPEIIAAIHGGDFANQPNLTCWKPWLEAWDATTGPDGKLLPIIPVIGNHDGMKTSAIFSEAYGMPGGNKNFIYSCNLSPQFKIVILNSEIPTTGEQQDFLKKTLEEYKANKVKWQLAAFHRPVYPAVKKPSSLKRFIPLFEEYNLDLVLESDGHCIKRTLPIKNKKHDPNGVVYLGEGGYGAPQRQTKDLWYLQEPGFASRGDHAMVLRVTPQSIDYQAISMNNEVLDQHSFKPKSR